VADAKSCIARKICGTPALYWSTFRLAMSDLQLARREIRALVLGAKGLPKS
jgi:hypothetical protein